MQPIAIEKHRPERRRRAVTTFNCGCSCCCCCCCLHTLGSLVGAAVAPAIGSGKPITMTHYYDDETGRQYPLINKPGLSAVNLFWWILCFLIFLCFTFGIVTDAGGTSVMITGIVVLMVFPALQLASLFLTLIVYACWPRPDKFYQLQQLAKVALGVVLGTVVGTLVMVGIGFACFGAFR